MSSVLSFLSRYAAWMWTTSSIMGFLISGRAWHLAYLYRKTNPASPTARYVQRQAVMRMLRLLGLVIVGVVSIVIYFAYPQTHQQVDPATPPLLQLSSLFTLLTLLSIPVSEFLGGLWTLQYLVGDPGEGE